MKTSSPVFGENKTNITNLLSAELAQGVVKVNTVLSVSFAQGTWSRRCFYDDRSYCRSRS